MTAESSITKLVFADVDGTILRKGTEQPSPEVVDVVRRMHEVGVALVPVTSRTVKHMRELGVSLRLRHLGVLDGGATIYNFATGEQKAKWLRAEHTQHIANAIAPFCMELYYGEESVAYTSGSKIAVPSPSLFGVCKNEQRDDITVALEHIAGIDFETNPYEGTSTHSCVQVVCAGVNKYTGVRSVLAARPYSQIAPEDIGAIGDGDPDVRLLRAVPLGGKRLAMGNAGAVLLQEMTPGLEPIPAVDNHGFAVAMERYVLR
jgi:HAD superfamily hydrolase (TIGR01484 family)